VRGWLGTLLINFITFHPLYPVFNDLVTVDAVLPLNHSFAPRSLNQVCTYVRTCTCSIHGTIHLKIQVSILKDSQLKKVSQPNFYIAHRRRFDTKDVVV